MQILNRHFGTIWLLDWELKLDKFLLFSRFSIIVTDTTHLHEKRLWARAHYFKLPQRHVHFHRCSTVHAYDDRERVCHGDREHHPGWRCQRRHRDRNKGAREMLELADWIECKYLLLCIFNIHQSLITCAMYVRANKNKNFLLGWRRCEPSEEFSWQFLSKFLSNFLLTGTRGIFIFTLSIKKFERVCKKAYLGEENVSEVWERNYGEESFSVSSSYSTFPFTKLRHYAFRRRILHSLSTREVKKGVGKCHVVEMLFVDFHITHKPTVKSDAVIISANIL